MATFACTTAVLLHLSYGEYKYIYIYILIRQGVLCMVVAPKRVDFAVAPINIMMVIDDQMVAQALNLCQTIIAHNPRERIHFYVVCEHVSRHYQAVLQWRFEDDPWVTMHLLTPNVALPPNVATSDRIPKAAYYRVLVDQLLVGQPVQRVLYLDVDMVNTGRLRSLYATDLGTKLIGAVADGGDLGRFAKMNLAHVPHERYFNSGMLLIDVARWRAEHVAQQVLAYAQANVKLCRYHDQDALNAILHDQWQPLHPRYNAQTNIMLGATQRFSKKVLQSVRQHPVLVHFCGHQKPWKNGFPHQFLEKLYYNAALGS